MKLHLLRIGDHELLERLIEYTYQLAVPKPPYYLRGDLAADLAAGHPPRDTTRPWAFRFAIIRWQQPIFMPEDSTLAAVNYFPAGGGLGWHTDSSVPGWRIYMARPLGRPGELLHEDGSHTDDGRHAVAFKVPAWHAVRCIDPRFSVGMRVGILTARALGLEGGSPTVAP